MSGLKFLLLGMYFGIVLYKSEVISWFRIQEMFRFQSIHMYGIIGLAVVVGIISVQLLKRFNIKSIHGEELNFSVRPMTKGTLIGGIIFGLGWALTGACPGPLYALVGSGYLVITVALISAILGTFTYGILKDKLPH